VRENGGQYTHGALWAVKALAEYGKCDRAAHLLTMLSPVTHGRDEDSIARYQVEPYVIAADVYGVEPHVGRGGWTWYTGSAGWMFRVALESILGVEIVSGKTLVLRPCIPDEWPGFSLRYRIPNMRTTYEIVVSREQGESSACIDAGPKILANNGALPIPLVDDGQSHVVVVTLGESMTPRYAAEHHPESESP
jgi:cyclic beta-1,2-glucan synthetase